MDLVNIDKNWLISVKHRLIVLWGYLKPINYWDGQLIHGQVDLVKFVESNKFDKVYSKIWNIFAWSDFLKIWRVLIHQVSWMKKTKSNFKSPQRKKVEENKTTNESTWNIVVARFSFGVLASLIFVILFWNIMVYKNKELVKTFRGYPQFYTHSSLLNGIQQGGRRIYA